MLQGLPGERGRERSTAIEGLTLAAAERLLIEQALSRTGKQCLRDRPCIWAVPTLWPSGPRMKKYGFLNPK